MGSLDSVERAAKKDSFLSLTMGKLSGTGAIKGDFGVELEIEGTNLPRAVNGWSIKPEGSLRGDKGRHVQPGESLPDTPLEYVLSKPVMYDQLRQYLDGAASALRSPQCVVRLGQRGSTHIHLNMSTETVKTTLAFILIYTIIEPILIRLCGNSRNGNLFCLPTYECGDVPMYVSQIASLNGKPAGFGLPRRHGKYASLNLECLATFGSIEVRCFPNEIDPTRIFKWATWLYRIRDIARSLTWPEVETFVERCYNTPDYIIMTVFREEKVFAGCYPTNPSELIHYGCEHAHEVWKAMQPAGQDPPVVSRSDKKRFIPSLSFADSAPGSLFDTELTEMPAVAWDGPEPDEDD